jgi:hypothetical protein
VKRNLLIVNEITAVDLPDGISVILSVHEAIYNDTANRSMLSELIQFVTNMEELRK